MFLSRSPEWEQQIKESVVFYFAEALELQIEYACGDKKPAATAEKFYTHTSMSAAGVPEMVRLKPSIVIPIPLNLMQGTEKTSLSHLLEYREPKRQVCLTYRKSQ